MTVSSANPDRLDTFVADAPAGRLAAADLARRGASLAADVMSRCGQRGLSAHNFGAITTLLDNMSADEQFVRGVADALRTADRHDGIATMNDVAIGARLVDGAYDTEGAPVTIAAVALLGEPANSGLVDDPVCAANGNFIHRDLDLAFPGTSAALNVHRFYNSLAADRVGAFGAGWTSVFDVGLHLHAVGTEADADDDAAPGTVTAQLADGAALTFHFDGERWSTRDRRRFSLTRLGRGWELHDGDTGARRWRFDRRGALTGWQVGRVGVSIARADDGRIVTLTHDRSDRQVHVTWAGGRITAIAADDGRTVAYTYGDRQTLARVESRSGWFDYAYEGRLMLSATDPDGVSEFRNEYDADGRVVRQTSPFGRVTTYRYELPGATVVTDQLGVRQAMVHDARGNLTAIIDADGAAMRLTHDEHDRVVEVVSQTGAIWRHEFDAVTGDLVRRTDPDGLAQTWEWDHLRRLAATADRSGGVTRLEYLGDHTVPSRVIGPDGAIATAELDTWGQPVVITDADGVVTRLLWDRDGQLAGLTDALGNTTTLEFDAAGLLVRLLDPSGTRTDLAYDHAARLVRGATGGRVHEFRYTPGGRVAGGVDPAEGPWSAVFGQHGAVTAITGAAGQTLRYRYDHVGNVTELTGPDGATFRQEFDDVGRLVAAFAPGGTASMLEHDPAGRVVAVTDPAGRTHRRTLDVMGRTATITAPDGAVTRWTYHPGGEVATVTVADGRTWTTDVDAMGRAVAVTDPAARRASRTFTPGGRLASRTDPTGETERYEYDAAGRCVAVVTSDGRRTELHLDAAGRPLAQTVTAPGHDAWRHTFDWGPCGDLVARTDPNGTTRWRRDDAGRVVTEIDGTGAKRRYDYDARGLLTTAVDPAGHATTYGYDLAGRLIEQIAPGERVTTWAHDTTGLVRSFTDPAGITTDVTRDPTGIVTALRRGPSGFDRDLDPAGRELGVWSPDGAPLARYAYDACGRMVSAESPLAGLVTEFLWDASDGVVPPAHAAHPDPDRPGRDAEASGHAAPLPRDAAGRLLVGPSGTVYRYDHAGRLVEIAPVGADATTFDFGPDGLLATERVGAQVRHFTYDAAGRVATITVDGVGTSVFTYDAAGRRQSQTAPDGTAVVFGWNDTDQLVSITRTSPDATVHHLAIDVDALGRPRRINGIDIDPGATAPVAVAGVVVLGARVYDPLTHQFLSADPLMAVPASNGGASAYTYAWHDPVNHIDPTGLRPISIEDYERMRTLEEQGRLGQAWQAIQDDPWGTLAMVGVVGAAFVIGGPIGIGIVVGAGMMAANGLATGRFNPRDVAIGGVAGGLTAGIGASGAGVGAAMVGNGFVGAGANAAQQLGHDQPFSWGQVLASGAGGAVTGGLGQYGNAANTTLARSIVIGAGTEMSGSAVQQTLTGSNPLSWETVAAGVSGGTTGGLTYHFAPPTGPDITPVAPTPDATTAVHDTTLDISPVIVPPRADFVAGPAGSGPPVPVSQSRMIEGFEAAGFPSTQLGNRGVQYELPDGTLVRAMQPTNYAPLRASFENANGGPIDPFTGKPPQPPPPPGMSMKDYVRDKTHVEQTP